MFWHIEIGLEILEKSILANFVWGNTHTILDDLKLQSQSVIVFWYNELKICEPSFCQELNRFVEQRSIVEQKTPLLSKGI